MTSPTIDIGANHLRLLRDGAEAYPAMLAAIAGAGREVLLEMYWIGRDTTGERFRAALTERAAAGVRVRVMYDAFGSLGLDMDWWEPLTAAGGEVREFGPVSPFRPKFHVNVVAFRDHRKILCIDGHIGFTGGINLADPWCPPAGPEHAWRDDAVEVRGPAVRGLRDVFYGTWRKLFGATAEDPRTHKRSLGARICVVANRFAPRPNRLLRKMYLYAVRRARRSIDITASYFVPGAQLLHALRKAAKRGVRVRVLIPGHSDMPVVDLATSSIIGRLLDSGVRVFAYRGRTLHAKTAVIDEKFVTIGSHNLDSLSWKVNLECNLAIADPNFARVASASFERDLEEADELRLETWKQRPLWLRVVGWHAALLGPFL